MARMTSLERAANADDRLALLKEYAPYWSVPLPKRPARGTWSRWSGVWMWSVWRWTESSRVAAVEFAGGCDRGAPRGAAASGCARGLRRPFGCAG